MKKLLSIFCMTLAITLAGCGGDSDSTSENSTSEDNTNIPVVDGQATLDSSNSTQFAKAAIEAVTEISSVSDANTTIPTISSSANSLALSSKLNALNIESLETTTLACEAGGSFSFVTEENDNSSTIIYDNCNDGDTITDGTFEIVTTGNSSTYNYDISTTYNGVTESTIGTITFVTSDDESSFTYIYDFTTTFNGVTETYEATYACTDLNTNAPTCRYSSPDYDIDGVTYTYEQTGDASTINGIYECPLDINSENDGTVSVVASGIENDCANTDYPSSGSITFTDADDAIVMTINFIDCTQFSIDFDGSVNTYNYAEFF